MAPALGCRPHNLEPFYCHLASQVLQPYVYQYSNILLPCLGLARCSLMFLSLGVCLVMVFFPELPLLVYSLCVTLALLMPTVVTRFSLALFFC